MKSEIEKYKVEGEIYIWIYKDNIRNYPGWNITFNSDAIKSLINLFKLLNSSEWSLKKKILTKTPSQKQINIPNNKFGNAVWKSKQKIVLNLKISELDDHWLINENEEEIEFQFGKAKLRELINALKAVSNKQGDFAISDRNEENILYLWWNSEI